MALPTLLRKLFKNDGYGPDIKDERLSTDITVKDWDASHDYPANVLAKAGGDIYRSVAASGPGTSAGAVNPTQDASADYWEVFGRGGSVPVGTVVWLSTSTAPVGFLLCNGQAVGRTTYPDLFDAIGTTYGAGDGSTTFNLPNLIDRFVEGSTVPGTVKTAGLPNITGTWATVDMGGRETYSNGAIITGTTNLDRAPIASSGGHTMYDITLALDASRSSAVYGNANTVQPPALTLLPCIKAYSDVDNLGSLDAAQLENYVQNNFVHLTGDESITGNKTFSNYNIYLAQSTAHYVAKLTNATKSTWPSGVTSNFPGGFIFQDKNGASLGGIQIWTDGKISETDLSVAYKNAMYGVNFRTNSSTDIQFHANPDNTIKLGAGNRRWKEIWAASTTISTSDERLKCSIQSIPDNVLDAWGSINFVQFQFTDAFKEKGQNARLHSGLIAQRIDNLFKIAGLDVSRYGLFCYDKWEAEAERIDPNGEVQQAELPAGDRFSIRYEEALCMEAAYQRRRADRAEARIASLEARLAALEARLDNSN